MLAELGARLIEPDGAAELLFPSTDNTPEGLYINSKRHVAVAQPGFTGVTGAGVDVRMLLGFAGQSSRPARSRLAGWCSATPL